MSKQSKKLKHLQSVWYRRLAKAGFKDIEDENGLVKSWSGSPLPGFSNDVNGDLISSDLMPITSIKGYSSRLFKESQAEYYRLASQFVYDKTFPSLKDKKIWRYHANGATVAQVAEKFGMTRLQAQRRIEKLRAILFEDTPR